MKETQKTLTLKTHLFQTSRPTPTWQKQKEQPHPPCFGFSSSLVAPLLQPPSPSHSRSSSHQPRPFLSLLTSLSSQSQRHPPFDQREPESKRLLALSDITVFPPPVSLSISLTDRPPLFPHFLSPLASRSYLLQPLCTPTSTNTRQTRSCRCTSISHTGQAPLLQPLTIDARLGPSLCTSQICPPSLSSSAHRPTAFPFSSGDTRSSDLQHSFHNRQICRLKKMERITNPNRAANSRTDLHKKEKLKSTIVCALFPFLQVMVVLTDSVGRQRRRRRSRSIDFAAFIGGGAWVHAPLVTVAHGATRRYCFCSFRGLPDTVSWILWGSFCKFKIV